MVAKNDVGTGSLKARQREARTELILEAALAVFAAKGYHSASMDEIAARVGIAKGTIYLHFAGKEELVGALLGRELKAFRAEVEAIVARSASARAKLEAVLASLYGNWHGNRRQLLLSLFLSVGIPKQSLRQAQELQADIAFVEAALRATFEAGKTSGELNTAIPTVVMLRAFEALLWPEDYAELLDDEQLSALTFAAYIGQIFFGGIAAPRPGTGA